ncbi:hypothetical protein, partial [Pedobacter nanyangensis]|uniref:hypothetical protein n=1 Tax=Pedobacter nanyangensis TaxID=1562389 RepID=UPI0013B3984C
VTSLERKAVVTFNEIYTLQFNLQKKSLKQLLSVKPPRAISDNLNQIEKRRALRKPTQKVLEMKTREDEKFIESITEIIVEI